MNLDEFRQQNPAYATVPDEQLATGLYRKYYSNKMSESEFMAQVGLKDTLGQGMMKTLENFPERMQMAAGGIMQSFGEREHPLRKIWTDQGYELPPAQPHPLAETGRRWVESAQQELQQNQPVGLTGGEQFAVDVARGVQDFLPAVGAGVATRSPAVTASMMGGQVYGQTYGDRRLQGQTPERANYAATFHALAEGIPETIPAISILKKGSTLLQRMFSGSLTEAGQETVTSLLQQTYDNADLEGMSLKEAIKGIDWNQALYEGAVGAGAGGTVATIVHPAVNATGEYLRNKIEDTRPVWAGALTRRQLADVSEDPGIKNYVDLATQMDADRNQLITDSAVLAKQWEAYPGKDALADLMYRSTLEEVDPSEGYRPKVTPEEAEQQIKQMQAAMRMDGGYKSPQRMERIKILRAQLKNEPQRQQTHADLEEVFQQLDPQGQRLFVQIRDAYQNRWAQMQQALEERIQRADAADHEKVAMIGRLRQEFQRAKESGPYFPLARFGDYWVYGEKAGQPAFSMVETRKEQKLLARDMEKEGYAQIKLGKKIESAPSRIGASASFVADVANIIESAGGQGHIAEKVRDELYQLYLQSLPDVSVQKSFIHRKKTKGFSENALRTYAHQMFHGAHQLARLRYTDRLEQQIDSLRQLAKDQPDSTRLTDYINELEKRHEWMLNPTSAPWAQAASQIGFGMYLGLSPAAAAVNLSQTPLVALPVMASEYGYIPASRELARASAAFVKGMGGIESTLTGNEARAYDQLVAEGVIDKTMAHNLAELAETESTILPGTKGKVSEVLSFLFHHAERFNREVTSIATYRLARSRGYSHNQALEQARDITYESHFDYANANRARFMQGNVSKVLLQFKQYAQQMSYLLIRNLYLATKGRPEVRQQARKKLTGILVSHSVAAGMVGLPLYSTVIAALNAAHDLFGDDEPWDAEGEFRQWLADSFGKEGGEMIAKGPVSSATGLDLSARVGLGELWFQSPNRELEGRAIWQHALEQVAGPSLGLIPNALSGLELMREGHVERGLERILPKFARDPLKAWRYAKEGAQTLSGAPLMEDLMDGEIAGQALGFNPTRLSERYDENSANKRVVDETKHKRDRLLNAYALAYRMQDTKKQAEITEQIKTYNNAIEQRLPSLVIKMQTIRSSIKGREKARATASHGQQLPKGYDALEFAR